jgi:hypothetical protein
MTPVSEVRPPGNRCCQISNGKAGTIAFVSESTAALLMVMRFRCPRSERRLFSGAHSVEFDTSDLGSLPDRGMPASDRAGRLKVARVAWVSLGYALGMTLKDLRQRRAEVVPQFSASAGANAQPSIANEGAWLGYLRCRALTSC